MVLKHFIIASACAFILIGCGSKNKISDNDCASLIRGISEIPFKNGQPANGNYYKVLEKADDKPISDCLLSQITNVTQMSDPRVSFPGRRKSVAIGDVSIFMLSRMYNIPYTDIIDKSEWENAGIYSYFEYVETDGARNEVAKVFREKLTRLNSSTAN